LLHQLRWRKTPPNRGRRWLVLGIVLVLHALFIWLTWHEMQSLRELATARPGQREALQVRLIPRPTPPPTEAPSPPPAPPAPAPATKPPVVHEPPAKNALTVIPPPAPAASVAPPAAQLYDSSGQIALPAGVGSAPAPEAPGYVQRGPQGDSKVMQHDHPVTYQATRFDKDWSKSSGNVVQDALKSAVDKTTVKHTFQVAPGVRIHCAVSFAALAGGCGGDPPPTPSSKSSDMRLNMAPANVLAPAPTASTPPSVEECIAIYRADKPLPQGCPVDTPTRAVDAEMRERAAHQNDQGGG
jgi:hypothetical protein